MLILDIIQGFAELSNVSVFLEAELSKSCRGMTDEVIQLCRWGNIAAAVTFRYVIMLYQSHFLHSSTINIQKHIEIFFLSNCHPKQCLLWLWLTSALLLLTSYMFSPPSVLIFVGYTRQPCIFGLHLIFAL